MTQRAHPRYRACVEATVEHRWLGNLIAEIRDVSANGIFVELPSRANLNPVRGRLNRTPITVRYRLPQGPAGRQRTWRGYVTRTGRTGVAASVSNPRPGGDPNLAMLAEYARRGEERRREVNAATSTGTSP